MSHWGMDRLRAILLSAGGALVAQSTFIQAAPLQQPSKGWVVDYGETACTAARTYGTDKAPVTLALRPSPNGNIVRFVLVRQGRVRAAEHFRVKTSITSDTTGMTGLRFPASDKARHIVWINFDKAALDGLASVGEIAIKAPDVDLRFALPGIAKVLQALSTCNEDLRAHWNVAAPARLTASATSIKPLRLYFSSADFPDQALWEGADGATRVAMMVDEAGALKDCMVEATSGIASLDSQACAVLLERAKFNPALDASGKPTRSVLTTNIRWANSNF